MGNLKSVLSVNKYIYPNDNDLYVELYQDIPLSVAEKYIGETAIDWNKADFLQYLELFVSFIADWNFADTKGEKLEITVDGLNKLPTSLASWIFTTIGEIMTANESKKKKR